jgi:hypothetical protein
LLPAAPTEFLHFRIVLAPIPMNDVPPKTLLQRLASRLDEQMRAPSERRIVALGVDDLG